MSEPVTPISGAYPLPALIVRNESAAAQSAAASLPASVPAASSVRMTAGPAVALAGAGWVAALHTSQRRGLRADETERRRYRASYARASNTPVHQAPRLERQA